MPSIERVAEQLARELGLQPRLLMLAAEDARYMGYRYILLQACTEGVEIDIVLRAENLYEDEYAFAGIVLTSSGRPPKPLLDIELDRIGVIKKEGDTLIVLVEAYTAREVRKFLKSLANEGLEGADKICGYRVSEEVWGAGQG